MIRHLITPEYPPQSGGVSDYTYLLAESLAVSEHEVHVWCPRANGPTPESPGVHVHHELGALDISDLVHTGKALDQFASPRQLLVQWVPTGYGWRSMNLAFCLWLWHRATFCGDEIELMVHEPFLPFGDGAWRQDVAAVVQRLMTLVLLRVPQQVWVSIPMWEKRLRPYALGRRTRFRWLPIPSNIPVRGDAEDIRQVHQRLAPEGGLLIGHFGTYGPLVTSLLEPILLAMRDFNGHSILLMGVGSDAFRKTLILAQPALESFVHATGPLPPQQLSSHIAACDLLIQPYPDGVSTRRTSFMAGLAHGTPALTTTGPLTELFWRQTECAAFAPAGDTQAFVMLLRDLCTDTAKRVRMAAAARQLYQERFAIAHTVAALRRKDTPREHLCAS